MTLNEYIDIEQNCRRHKKDNEGYLNSLRDAQKRLEELNTAYTTRLESISGNKQEYLKERVSVEIGRAIADNLESIHEKQVKLNTLQKSKIVIERKELEDYYLDYTELAHDVKKRIQEQQKRNINITRILPRQKVNIKSIADMDKIYDALEKYKKEVSKSSSVTSVPLSIDKAVAWIFKGSALAKHLNSMGRLIYTAVYYLLLGLLILVFTELFLLYIFVAVFIYFHGALPIRKEQIEIFKTMSFNMSLCDGLLETVNSRVSKKESALFQKQLEINGAEIDKLTTAVEELKRDIEVTKVATKDRILKSSENKEYETEQRKIVEEEFKQSIEEVTEEISAIQDDYDTSVAEYDELVIQRDKGKEELEAMYFKLDVEGTSKLLPRKFLLGFNEYIPLTMDMPNYTINLPTNARAKDIVKSFVYMCLVQILCTTNPSCVDITIVDLLNGTSDYGMFAHLDEIIHIVKNEAELSKALDEMYEEKTLRDTSIKSKFDNIDDYNNYMISQYGITKTYKILIVTHQIDELFSNSIFRQLQSSGDVGIVTVTIWDKNIFVFNPKKKKEYYMKLIDYLPNMQNAKYLGDGGELDDLDSKYITAKLQYITEQARRMN